MRYLNLIDERQINQILFRFPLPGATPNSLVWLDIECEKVPAGPSWPYKTRTKTIMVGLSYFEEDALIVEIITGNERQIMDYLNEALEGKRIVYTATRSYDRLVLEGKWTYARRGPKNAPGNWPHIKDFERNWENLRLAPSLWRPVPIRRSTDVASAEVPNVWRENPEVVVLHNVRDLIELVSLDSRSFLPWLNPTVMMGDVEEALKALALYKY